MFNGFSPIIAQKLVYFIKDKTLQTVLNLFYSKRLTMQNLSFFMLTIIGVFYFNNSSAQISVTDTGPGTDPTSYTTFRAFITAVNAGTHTGAITATFSAGTSDTGSGGTGNRAIQLEASGVGSASYTSITIDDNGSGPYTVSGSIHKATSGGGDGALFEMDGASNVSITDINFTNTSSNSGSLGAVLLFDAASSNTFTNCTFSADYTGNSTRHGVVSLGVTDESGDGCASNTFSSCIFKPNSTTSLHGVYSYSATTDNSSNTVTGGEIYNYFEADNDHSGIRLAAGSTGWTISNVEFYQTTTRTIDTDAVNHSAIRILDGTGYTISGNTIGYSTGIGVGTYTVTSNTGIESTFSAIHLDGLSSTSTSTISSNTITNITFSTEATNNALDGNNEGAFTGILVGPRGTSTETGSVTISSNTLGNSAGTTNLRMNSVSGTTAEMVLIYTAVNGTVQLTSNTIAGCTARGNATTESPLMTAIRCLGSSATVTVSSNIIGNSSVANSLAAGTSSPVVTGSTYVDGIDVNNTGTNTISSNTLSNLRSYGDGTNATYSGSDRFSSQIGIITSSGANTISSNTLTNLHVNEDDGFGTIGITLGAGDTIRVPLIGIYCTASGINSITNNTISSLITNNSTSTEKHAVWGINMRDGANGSVVSGNKIHSFTNASTVAQSYIAGIVHLNSGTYDIQNNMISLSATAKDFFVDGIATYDNVATDMYYNSIYIGGTAGAGTLSSSCIYTSTTGTNNINNNILWNGRSGSGTDKHYCLIIESGATDPTSCDYNTYFASATNGHLASRASTDQSTLSDFVNDFSNDYYSWSETGTDVPSVGDFFTDQANGDLSIVTGNSEAWYVNGKGDPRIGVSTDIDGNSRSTTVAAGTTDIGADEFTAASTPPLATETGTIGSGNTTTYTFANKEIMQITWGAASSYPGLMVVQYYSGDTPPNPNGPTANYGDGYWFFTPGSGSLTSGTYTITTNFGPHETGSIVSPNTATIYAKTKTVASTDYWFSYSAGSGNEESDTDYSTDPKTVVVRGLSEFSSGALTDTSDPLPVELIGFYGKRVKDLVELTWITALEKDNDYFTIERSNDGSTFHDIANVAGKGNSAIKQFYFSIDNEPIKGLSYYRLKQTDFDGTFSYSKVIAINFETTPELLVYPNPSSKEFFVSIDGLNATEKVYFSITDALGRTVQQFERAPERQSIRLSLNENGALAKGVYTLTYWTRTNRSSKKIVIQ